MVRSPLTAASATFALKAGEWFRRGRLFMVSPVHGDYRRYQAEIPLIVLSRFPGPALTPMRTAPIVDLSCFAARCSFRDFTMTFSMSAAGMRETDPANAVLASPCRKGVDT